MNNEAAQIKLVTNTAIANQVVTAASQGQSTQTSNTAERAATGIILKMTPQINDDGSINLYVEPSVTTAVASAFFPETFLDPTTRSVRTLARIMNNETLVLGGLIDSDQSTAMKKIPGLGDVPLFGKAFTYKDRGDTERELLIFITPHIIDGFSSLGAKSATASGKEPSMNRMFSDFRENETERNLITEDVREKDRARVTGDELGLYRKKMKQPEAPGMDKEMTRSLELFSTEPVRAGTK
jgi:type II secretory pathway component GspD/PulD (secretin)